MTDDRLRLLYGYLLTGVIVTLGFSLAHGYSRGANKFRTARVDSDPRNARVAMGAMGVFGRARKATDRGARGGYG